MPFCLLQFVFCCLPLGSEIELPSAFDAWKTKLPSAFDEWATTLKFVHTAVGLWPRAAL